MRSTRYVYALWSPDRSCVYVGQTSDVRKRHKVSVSLGCVMEIGLEVPDAQTGDLTRTEDRIMLSLRSKGVRVVSLTYAENAALKHGAIASGTQRGWDKLSPEQRSERSKAASVATKARWARMSPEERSAAARHASLSIPPEQRRINAAKGAKASIGTSRNAGPAVWETRRARYGPTGTKKSTKGS